MRYVIPLASGDDLFPKDEFHFPKPLIEINGRPMISYVIDNIRLTDPDANFIFIIRREDSVLHSLASALELLAGAGTHVVELSHATQGAICSVLMAIELVEDDAPLVICNGDQVIDVDFKRVAQYFQNNAYDAGVITFNSVHPRWSYVRIDDDGFVSESAEKRVISRAAIAGYYYFKSGKQFVAAATSYLLNGEAINGRYYLSPSLNEIILVGGKVGVHSVADDQYTSFYSPQRVEYFQQTRSHESAGSRGPSAIQIVVPMAGLGSRFSKEGYVKPKPFIDVNGKTMIERVMDNLRTDDARFVLIARQEHLDAEPDIHKALERNGVDFLPINFVTEGPACTVMTARSVLRYEDALVVANCDQIIDFDLSDFIADARRRKLDGSILVFREPEKNPKWSFARLGANGLVLEVKEKVPISDLATVGIYYFAKTSAFFDAAIDMIALKDRTNDEFYVCPMYNYLINNGGRVGVYEIEQAAMHGIGTPSDLKIYLEHVRK